MKAGLIVALLCPAAVSAQKIVDISQFGPIGARFDPQVYQQKLDCEVKPIKPALNFAFRFQAGYVFRVAMNQYVGPSHQWVVDTRIRPESGNRLPVYFEDSIKFSMTGNEAARAGASGGYWLGEGNYTVTWLLMDDLGRICRKEWKIGAALGSRSDPRLTIPPNTVVPLSFQGPLPSNRQASQRTPMRLTVLLDAAPLISHRASGASLDGSDRLMLLGGLSEMLNLLPASSVRLVLFNLEDQRELFRQDGFTLEAIDKVGQALNDLNLQPVDYRTLQNQEGHLSFLVTLINQEASATPISDAVIFLGPQERYRDKPPDNALEKARNSNIRFFYLQYRPIPQLVRADKPDRRYEDTYRLAAQDSFDSISMAMKSLRGLSLPVYSPDEFIRAVEQVDRQVLRDH